MSYEESQLLCRTGVPWVAILVGAVSWGLCLKLGFANLLLLDTSLCPPIPLAASPTALGRTP